MILYNKVGITAYTEANVRLYSSIKAVHMTILLGKRVLLLSGCGYRCSSANEIAILIQHICVLDTAAGGKVLCKHSLLKFSKRTAGDHQSWFLHQIVHIQFLQVNTAHNTQAKVR